MITIGLVGGVASGKSVIACDFQKLGAGIIDGDRIGHEVLAMVSVREQLSAKWGESILDGEQIHRPAIAELVFTADRSTAKKNLAFLESVTHPEIERVMQERITKMRQLDRFPVAVIDAAVMMKAGWDRFCDRVVFVDSPLELRRKRAQLRGLDAEQFEAREASQLSVEEKKKRAHIVIDNSGPPNITFHKVEEVWHELLQKVTSSLGPNAT